MFEYCSRHAERTYKLIEDGDFENGLDFLAHLADVLNLLVESRNDQGVISINEFAQNIKKLNEIEKDNVYDFLQETGFGQYIPE